MTKLPDDWMDRLSETTRTLHVAQAARGAGGSASAAREADVAHRDAMRGVLAMLGASGRRPPVRTGLRAGMGMTTGTRRSR